MQVIGLKCKYCGAELEAEPGQKEAICAYCGSKIILDDGSVVVTNRYVDEARVKEAELKLKELEYRHEKELRKEAAEKEKRQEAAERELRKEATQKEQKKAYRLAVCVFFAVLAFAFLADAEGPFPGFVMIFGGAAILSMRAGIKKEQRGDQMYATSPKSRTTALILCIFAGFFGAHYFYAGKIGKGILYLCTLGLFGVGWIIDIIRIIFGTFTDKNGMYLRG
jgi:restriction system protein